MIPEAERLRFHLYARLPIFAKRVQKAREFVALALTYMTKPYIAFSTGKDSLVMAQLVWDQDPHVPAVYFDADCAYPETLDVLNNLETQGYTIIRYPCEPLLDTFARMGGPSSDKVEDETMKTTVYEPIKRLLAEHQFDGVFLGLRAEESAARRMTIRKNGQFFYRKSGGQIWECLPIAYWKYIDIWAYILKYKLAYNKVYDKMWGLPERSRRVSYWAGESSQQRGRWLFLRRHYPELFNKLAEKFPEVRSCL